MRRRGAIALMVAVMAVVIVGFAALVVDVGLLYAAKSELQRSADAAALAGVSAYISDDLLRDDLNAVQLASTTRVQEYGLANLTLSAATTIEVADIAVGRHDFADPAGGLGNSGLFNAVQVTTRRTTGSSNGPVPFFFARIWGRNSGDVTATARAAVDDRFLGVNAEQGPPLLPLSVDVDLYAERLAANIDEYSFDGGGIVTTGDGVFEAKLFPDKAKKNDDEEDGSGNFGLLNIDGNGNAVQVGNQIRYNISAEELINEFGTAELVFYNENGAPITYSINGATGLTASIQSDLDERIGQVVGFFVHDDVTGTGSNAMFRSVGLKFGRLMHVELNGSDKEVVIQPVIYTGPAVMISESAPSSGGMVVNAQIVQ
jgi:hypothetical protein